MSEWVANPPAPCAWEAWLRANVSPPDFSRLPDSTPVPKHWPAREGVEL